MKGLGGGFLSIQVLSTNNSPFLSFCRQKTIFLLDDPFNKERIIKGNMVFYVHSSPLYCILIQIGEVRQVYNPEKLLSSPLIIYSILRILED